MRSYSGVVVARLSWPHDNRFGKDAVDNHFEEYECCGIPASVYLPVEEEPVVEAPLPGATRRQWVTREMALLGIEALPSTIFEAEPPSLGH